MYLLKSAYFQTIRDENLQEIDTDQGLTSDPESDQTDGCKAIIESE